MPSIAVEVLQRLNGKGMCDVDQWCMRVFLRVTAYFATLHQHTAYLGTEEYCSPLARKVGVSNAGPEWVLWRRPEAIPLASLQKYLEPIERYTPTIDEMSCQSMLPPISQAENELAFECEGPGGL